MRRALCSLVAVLATAVAANAAPVTSLSGINTPRTTLNFSQFTGANQFFGVSGPVQVGTPVGQNITASASNSALWLYDGGWGLLANGSWDASQNGYVGVWPNNGPVRFDFLSGPVSGVGFDLNYIPDFAGPVTLNAYDSSNNLLETFNIQLTAPISTPGGLNASAFRGIQLNNANIAYITVFGQGAVLDNLVFTRAVTAVPEPLSVVVFGGLLAAGGLAVRRRAKATA
jgi:hypothetical protein